MKRPARPAAPHAAAGSALAGVWTAFLDRSSLVPLSVQLANCLRQAITEGRLASGAKLPSTRDLSVELGVSRATVVVVFEQLVAEGFIHARQGSGFYVLEREPIFAGTTTISGPRPLSARASLVRSLAAEIRSAPLRPFELGNAEVDAQLIKALRHAARRALAGRGGFSTFYDASSGDKALRQRLASYLAAARAVRCRPEQIVVTTGTRQSLSLAASLLLDPGDPVWLEDPCYHAARHIFSCAGAHLVPVPVDERGMMMESARVGDAGVRAIYVTPSHQFPLGGILPISRRQALIDIARRSGAWILEDDYDSEFHYDGRVVGSLQGLDTSGRVLYLGTLSKVLFPSLRLGYMVVPEDLVDTFTAGAQLFHRQSSAVLQAIASEFIANGHFGRHLKRMRQVYAEQLAFVLADLRRALPEGVTVQGASRGMHLILWLPAHWNDRQVAAKLDAAGVSARPLSVLAIEHQRPPGLVLGYTGFPPDTVRRAVATLAEVLRHHARHSVREGACHD